MSDLCQAGLPPRVLRGAFSGMTSTQIPDRSAAAVAALLTRYLVSLDDEKLDEAVEAIVGWIARRENAAPTAELVTV